jgi:hypothetical protein
VTQTQVKVDIAKVMLDGDWHSTPCLVAHVGYLIRPEIAYRSYTQKKSDKRKPNDDQKIAAGRNRLVRSLLRYWLQTHRIERQGCQNAAEWRSIDKAWFESFLNNPH